MGRRIGRRVLLRFIAVLGTGLWLLNANAQGLAAPLTPQLLADALETYAKRTGYEVVYRTEVVAGLTTPGADVGLSATDTLAQLLRGTGLHFAFVNDRTVAIFKSAKDTLRFRSPGTPDPRSLPPQSAIGDVGKAAQNRAVDDTTIGGERTVTHRGIFRRIAGALALFVGTLAAAANSPSDLPAGSADSEELQEITVTARRRAENIQTVPIAITVFSQDKLSANNIQTFADLQYLVPSMSLNHATVTGENFNISIRGQGSNSTGAQGQEGVIVFLNEAPLPGIAGLFVGGPGMFFDLENLQVLEGPQGTLFGRNSVGGDILLQSARPTREFGGNIQASYGNHNDRELNGAINIPLVKDVLLTRFAFSRQVRDGYTHLLSEPSHPNGIDLDNRDTYSVRGSIAFLPADWLRNDTIITYTHFDDRNSPAILWAVNTPGYYSFAWGGLPAALQAQQALGIRASLPIDIDQINAGHTLVVNNNTNVTLPDGLTLRSIFSYSEATQIQTAPFFTVGIPPVPHLFDFSTTPERTAVPQYTEELQLQGKSLNRMEWIVGAFYMNQPFPDYTLFSNYVLGAVPLDFIQRARQKSEAVFAQSTYDLSDLIPRLKVTGGVRYTKDEEGRTIFGGGVGAICPGDYLWPAAAVANCSSRSDLSAHSHALTYTAGLDYQLVPEAFLYLTVSRGYRPGGFNQTDLNTGLPQPNYAPEFVRNYELGIKSNWTVADTPVHANANLWKEDFTDIQTLENGVPPNSLVQNAAKAKLWGAELEASADLFGNLRLGFDFDYLHFAYSQFDAATQGIPDLIASETLNRPRYKYGVNGRYRLPVPADLGSVTVQANWNWQSANGDTSVPYAVTPAFGLLNMNLDWTEIYGKPVDLSLFASNLLDKDYLTQAGQSFNWLQGYSARKFGEPRMYGVRLRYRFGASKNE